MHGGDLHRGRVAVEAAAAPGEAALFGGADAVGEPAGQRRETEALGERDVVEELGDVAQVGELAFPVLDAEQPGGEIGVGGQLVEDRGEPRAPEQPRRLAQLRRQPADEIASARVDLGGRDPQDRGAGGQAHPVAAMRLLQGAEHPQPVGGRRGGEHAGAACQHRGHPDVVEGLAHDLDLGAGPHQHRDVAGADRPPLAPGGAEGDPGLEQPDQVGGQIRGDALALPAHRREPGPVARAAAVAAEHSQAQGHGLRGRSRQAGLLAGGADRVDGDIAVPEFGPAEDVVERGEQPGVAAPVVRQLAAAVGVGDRVEVAEHLRAAEGVDGLLRVADQHQGPVTVEGQPQDVPLQRVGVLELVDQGHPVAVADPLPGAFAVLGIGEHGVQQDQQVVEVAQPCQPGAAFGLGAHRRAEGHPRTAGPVVVGREGGVAVVHGGQGQGVRVAQGERGPVAGVAGQVQVLDDGGDEVVDRFGEPGAGVVVARQPELVEHALAERVGGGDGARVEIGEGGEQSAPVGRRGGGVGGQQGDDLVGVGARGGGVGQGGGDGDEPFAGAFAQFLRGGPAEGHQQQVRHRDRGLGDVAHRQPDDGVGLAGARAGLEDRRPGGQRPGGIEGDRGGEGSGHGCP